MIRYPETPRLVTLDHLKLLDKDPPGTWLAQPKLDGRRRMAFKVAGKWTYFAKNRGDALVIPLALRQEFEAMDWPDGIGLDMEWTGLRQVGDMNALYVFDLLAADCAWAGAHNYGTRQRNLARIWSRACGGVFSHAAIGDHLSLAPIFSNSGLCDRFAEQISNPLSEGLVVRRADSIMQGSLTGCKDGPGGGYKVKFNRQTKEAL